MVMQECGGSIIRPRERRLIIARVRKPPLVPGTKRRGKGSQAGIRCTGSLRLTPTFKQSYAPQSGEIFGILEQMKETFESNLSAAQKKEAESQKAYERLKAAKDEECRGQRLQKRREWQLAVGLLSSMAQSKVAAIMRHSVHARRDQCGNSQWAR